MTEGLPPTEGVDEATRGLDRMPTADLVRVLLDAQGRAADAARSASQAIARAADVIAARLRAGGTLHYVGAGTSGRLGALDAAELPPTFGTPPSLARAHIAGGSSALTAAVEGAEDDAGAAGELDSHIRSGDVVIGISASGSAAYVVTAVERAREAGAFTIGITSTPDAALAGKADLAIVLPTGAEPLAGSTRMVAGTAQKIVLSALSTAAMIRLGKVYDNLMVDLVATNAKLRRRALRLVRTLCALDDSAARELLDAAGGSVKVAVVMQQRRLDAPAARALLSSCGDSLREALES